MKRLGIVVLVWVCACAAVETPRPQAALRLLATTSTEVTKARATVDTLGSSRTRPLCVDLVFKGQGDDGSGPPTAAERGVIDALDRNGYRALDVHNTQWDPTALLRGLQVRRYLLFPVEVCTLSADAAMQASAELWRDAIPHGWTFADEWVLYCPASLRDGVEDRLRTAGVAVRKWAKRAMPTTSPTKKTSRS